MKTLEQQIPATWWASPHLVESALPDRGSEAKTAFSATVLFTFILLLSPQNWFPFLRPLRIAFLAAGCAVAALLWDRWKHARPLGFTAEVIICFSLIAWAFVTAPLSYWPGGSIATVTDLYVKAVAVFWLLSNVVTTHSRLRRLTNGLIACSVILAATGVNNFRNGVFVAELGSVARIAGYGGNLAGNPNDLALMLNLLLPFAVAQLLGASGTRARVFWLGAVAINVIGVVVTFSRGGFLALAAIGLVYFAKLMRRAGPDRRWAVAMLVLAVLALPLVPAAYVERVSTVSDIASDPTQSSQSRWRDMVAAAHFVATHPIIGAGIGMDILALNEVRGAYWVQVHNVYLQYAVDLGLPGAFLFVLLLWMVFRAVKSSMRRLAGVAGERPLFLLAEAVQVSLIAFVVSSMFHPVAYHFYFYYIAGLALAVRAIAREVVLPPTLLAVSIR